MEITYLKGVGPKRAELYKKLGVDTVEQLIELYPRDYVDFTCPKKIAEVQIGEVCAFRAFVKRKTAPFSEYARMALYKAELTDGTGNITAVFFNAKYTFAKLEEDHEYLFYGKISGDMVRLQVGSPLFVEVTQGGLMPKYPLTAGLTNNMVSANVRTALSLVELPETGGAADTLSAVSRGIHRSAPSSGVRGAADPEAGIVPDEEPRKGALRRGHEGYQHFGSVGAAPVPAHRGAAERRVGLYPGYAA